MWGWEVASYHVILVVPLDSPHGSHVPISKILYTELGGRWPPYLASRVSQTERGFYIPRVSFFFNFCI